MLPYLMLSSSVYSYLNQQDLSRLFENPESSDCADLSPILADWVLLDLINSWHLVIEYQGMVNFIRFTVFPLCLSFDHALATF